MEIFAGVVVALMCWLTLATGVACALGRTILLRDGQHSGAGASGRVTLGAR
jgi:hypothetical protein